MYQRGVIAPVCAAVMAEPCFDLVEPGTQPILRDADADADGEMPFSLGDHEAFGGSPNGLALARRINAHRAVTAEQTSTLQEK